MEQVYLATQSKQEIPKSHKELFTVNTQHKQWRIWWGGGSALEIAMQIARIAILIGQLWIIHMHPPQKDLQVEDERDRGRRGEEGGRGYGKITCT